MLTSKLIEEEHVIEGILHLDGESMLRITTSRKSDPRAPHAEILLSTDYTNILQVGTVIILKRFSSQKNYLSLKVGDVVFDL